MKFTFQPLETFAEKQESVGIYANLCGDAISKEKLEALEKEYLPYAQFYAWKDASGSMVAGYTVAPGEHSRLARLISRKSIDAVGHPLSDCLELNFVWISPEWRKSPLAFRLWGRIARDLGTRPEKAILYLVSTTKKGLVRLYQKVSVRLIAEEILPDYGVPFRLYLSTPARFRLILFLYGFEMLARLLNPVSLFRGILGSAKTPEPE